MWHLFLQENEDLSPLIRQHLLEIINDPQDLQDLRLELGVMVDVGVHFVNAAYYLEGDGPLIFTCFEHLSAVSHAVTVGHYLCTLAVAREIANGDAALQNRLITQAKACVQPGLNFFQQKFNVQFLTNVRAFKAARLCCPVQVSALKPDARALEELKTFHLWMMPLQLTWQQSCHFISPPLMALCVTVKRRNLSCGGQHIGTLFHTGLHWSGSYYSSSPALLLLRECLVSSILCQHNKRKLSRTT